MTKWGCRYGRWWMVQWVFDGWFSLGIHLDLKHRTGRLGDRTATYGPYMDLHLGCVIVSVGWQPAYSSNLERVISVSRGGING